MSIAALNWARKQRVGDAAGKLVLMVLADYASEDGQSWPSINTIAEVSELSSRSVIRKLERLEELKLIARSHRQRANGSNASNIYQLGMPAEDVRQTERGSDRVSLGVVTDVHPPSDRVSLPEQSLEPKNSPSPARARETTIQEDWKPRQADLDWAAETFPKLEITHETDSFRDYWIANGGRKVNWDAAFRNWLRKSSSFASRPSRATTAYPSRTERMAQRNRDILARVLSGGGEVADEPEGQLALEYRTVSG
jgi:hypothetical protein